MKNKLIVVIIAILVLSTAGVLVFSKTDRQKNSGTNKINPSFDNTFSILFLRETNKISDGNYLVSPYSVEIALSMLRDGAKGNTKFEIDKVIGNEKIGLIDNKSVHIANALFIREMYKDGVVKTFSQGIKDNYKSEILYDKFETPDVINNWVDKNTEGMIKKVVDQMSDDFVLGLANALAIDVKWKYEFECQNTHSREFTKENKEKINVEMMNKMYSYESDVKYIENDRAKGIIIPYTDDDNLEFIGILPNDSIDNYINSFSLDELNKMEENATIPSSSLRINLSLPRFKYDFDFKEFLTTLKSMGIREVFDPNNADLTIMMSRDKMMKYGFDNLYVGEAVHKTHIDLNEEGTKAAAVTYFAVYKNESIAIEPEYKTINIEFNKTFLYMIRDKSTKKILFMGVVDSPNEWNGTTCKIEG